MRIEIKKIRNGTFDIVEVGACGNGSDACVGHRATFKQAIEFAIDRHFEFCDRVREKREFAGQNIDFENERAVFVTEKGESLDFERKPFPIFCYQYKNHIEWLN